MKYKVKLWLWERRLAHICPICTSQLWGLSADVNYAYYSDSFEGLTNNRELFNTDETLLDGWLFCLVWQSHALSFSEDAHFVPVCVGRS